MEIRRILARVNYLGELNMLNEIDRGKIEELFEEFKRPGSPGCAVGVMIDGELAYKGGFGLANLEYDIPIKPDTVFHVASMSKQFTAMAALFLDASGKISLDDPIGRYLPDCPRFAQDITVRHIIHHTSGLRSDLVLLIMAGWRLEDVITNGDVMELFRNQEELNFKPGEQFSYSGTGYLVLTSIIEEVSGQSLDSFCRRMIFEPLGMKSTFFNDDYLRVVKDRAYAYYPNGEDGYKKAVLTCSLTGGTGLFTTIEDLAKWDENFYTAEVGGPVVIDKMNQRALLNSDEVIDYGYGLFIEQYGGREIVAHGGDGAGIHCFMMRFPEEHLTVAVLGNLGSIKARKLAQMTADICFGDAPHVSGKQAHVPSAIKLTEEQMLEKVGRYYDADGASFVDVEIHEGSLRVWGYDVMPQSENCFFFAVSPDASAEFSGEPEGEPRELTIDTGLTRQHFGWVEKINPTQDYLRTFEGSYFSRELDLTWTIAQEDSNLVVKRRRQGQSKLTAITNDVFADGWMGPILHSSGKPLAMAFERDRNRAVSGFRISDSGARVKNLRFVKVGR
jgi:CubicO group peptidase (beta-lactamase class C family)